MSIKEHFTNNIGWKIGGIALALMLWFHLATEKNYEEKFTAEIEYAGLTEDLYVEEIEPPEVEIKVIGTGKQLAYLDLVNPPRIRIDLSSVKEAGAYRFNINLMQIYNIDPFEYPNVDFPGADRCNVVIKRRT